MARNDPTRVAAPPGEPAPRGRIAPPRRPAVLLPRPELVARARTALEGPLVRVVAGAGWGKSVLLSLATGDLPVVVWCACDPRGARTSLVPQLALAFARRVPGFRAEAGAGDAPERRVAGLCDEIARVAPAETLLVVDDAHLLAGTPGEAELALLAASPPPQLRLAVAGREELPASLGGARPDAVDLDEDALALDPDEARGLVEALGPDLGAGETQALLRDAEGWVTGLVIGAQGADPAAYLDAEVLARQPPEAAALLEETSPLERFTPDMAAHVSARPDTPALLEGLVRRHAFVRPDEGGDEAWHRQHPMLRALARRRLARRPAAERTAIDRRAAAAWTRVGRPEEAARHHLRAGDLAAAVAALEPATRGISGPERASTVASWLDAIPPELWSDTSGLVLAQASALFYRADYLGAFAAMEGAVERLVAGGDHDRAAATLVRLLRAVPLAGGLHDRAIATARRLLPRITGEADMLPAARVVLALLLAEACRYDEAEEELAAALAQSGGDPGDLTALQASVTRAFAIDHPRARRTEALAALDAAIPRLDAAGPADPLNYLVYARAFRAIVLADVGRFDEALAEADRVREAAAARGLARLAVPVVAMLRFGALAGLERWDDLEVEIARTAPAFRRLGGALRGYRHDVARAQLAAVRGDAGEVGRAVGSARDGLALHGHPYDAAMALADLALAADRAGLGDLARVQVADARAEAERARAPWAATRAEIVAAHVLGPGGEGDAALAEAVARSADPRMVALWARRERRLATELLPRALAGRAAPADLATRLASACGGEVLTACVEATAGARPEVRVALAEAAGTAVAADAALERLVRDADPGVRRAARAARDRRRSRPRAGVRLVTLGGFAVHRDGRPLPDSAFGRQKARALLAMLACARGAVHREALVDGLWPDLSAKRGLAALNSTLYALRRGLEPELAAGDSSSLVVAEGPTYRLVLGEADSWDAADFLARARAALAAPGDVDALLAAEAAWTGPFLPEWTFAPWTEPLRTELGEAHRAVLVGAAEALAAAGRAEEAISRYRLLLAMEPEREGWHRALMRVYARAGERGLALRQFEACRRALREGLGVEPSRETRDLHAELLREG